MAETISKTFVIAFLLDYLLIFGVLLHWTIRTWVPKASKRSDPKRSHDIAQPH
jgi:hypothetical protein